MYDMLNRPVLTGIYATSQSHQYLINSMPGLYYIGTTSFKGMLINALPFSSATTTFQSLSKTDYDGYDYDWDTNAANGYDAAQKNNLDSYDDNAPSMENIPDAPSLMTTGLPTASYVRVIEDPYNIANNSTWITTVTYYDDKGRVVQINSTNYKGGIDIVTNKYDFANKILTTFTDHHNPESNNHTGIATDMDFDHAGRILKIRKRMFYNGTIVQSTKISDNNYDPLGLLITKTLGQKRDDNGNYTLPDPLETLNYEYNIRGWLKSINKNFAKTTGSNNINWFGMILSYDWGFSHSQYNGNIAGITWRSKGDGQKRAYGFGYDNANRILYADFNQYTSSNWNKSAGIDFSVYLGTNGTDYTAAYDANGNIKKMQQKGILLTSTGISSIPLDNLTYTYYSNTNKLSGVSDANTTPTGLGDFTDKNTSGNDYGYDVNGNLITDKK